MDGELPSSPFRCAIYTLKSTEEGLAQEFNTLEAQRESAEAYVQSQVHAGWTTLVERYDDGGFTGANLERPAPRKLLVDIEAGRIDCVLVYKVDRLSRSLLDFARLMEIFERGKVSLVSVTQPLNTTGSLGRLTLNILLSFAEFERQMIADRTRDKMGAARRKGKWVGGMPVLGYDIADAGMRSRPNASGRSPPTHSYGYLSHRADVPNFTFHCVGAIMARPKFVPTDEQRRTVKSLSAYGIKQEGIARVLRFRSPKTLRKHFREELSLGEIEAVAQVAQTHYQMAKSGKYPGLYHPLS